MFGICATALWICFLVWLAEVYPLISIRISLSDGQQAQSACPQVPFWMLTTKSTFDRLCDQVWRFTLTPAQCCNCFGTRVTEFQVD
jgi:hypothetical protein